MSKIRMLVPMAGPAGCRKAGWEYSCEDSEAAALVKGGYAERVQDAPPPSPAPAPVAEEGPPPSDVAPAPAPHAKKKGAK